MQEDNIAQYESRLKEAMLTSDTQALDQLLSDELIFTSHFGQLMNKQDDIEAHRSGMVQIDVIEQSEQNIKRLSEEMAVVSVICKIRGTFAGVQSTAALRFTRIWQKIDDNFWKVVVAHSSEVNFSAL